MERVWLWLRERFLSLRVFANGEAIVDACCRAWNAFADDADRIRSLCLQPWIEKVILERAGISGEIFYSLAEARVVIAGWRQHYNTVRPHSSLCYRPPAPEVVLWPAMPAEAAPHAAPTVAPKPTMH